MHELDWIKASAIAAALAVGAAYLGVTPASAAGPTDALSVSFQLEAAGNLAGALRSSREAADKDPKHYFARLRVAFLELSLKDYEAAERDYARAAGLAPEAVEPLLGRQQALLALARYKDAEAVGRAVIARDPNSYLGNSRLAWALFNLKRYDAAAKFYAAVLALYPGDLEMLTGLGYAQLRGGRKREAAESFRGVLSIVKNHPRARQGLAACR
jgi:tetratricopeptide (TPR) repeat protein